MLWLIAFKTSFFYMFVNWLVTLVCDIKATEITTVLQEKASERRVAKNVKWAASFHRVICCHFSLSSAGYVNDSFV